MLIIAFRGPYRFLGNESWCDVTFDGVVYPSIAHAFQSAKTLNKTKREEIRKATRFKQVSRLGATLVTRRDWKKVQCDILESLLRQKFAQPKFREVLLSTKDYKLINGDHRGETYWGMIYTGRKWVGDNRLGKLLMKIREEIRSSEKLSNTNNVN